MTHDCYIVGNGVSLAGFDFGRLRGKPTIGADYAAFLAGCRLLCSVTDHFISTEPEIIISFGKRAYIYMQIDLPFYPTATAFKKGFCFGFARAPGILQGFTSEFAALNLAVKSGFKDIALLGCDFVSVGTSIFFHDATYESARRLYMKGPLEFDTAAPVAESLGVRITNYTGPYGSAITAFPVRPLETLQ